MKIIIKYVIISFGLLFLSSFFFVEKTYGAIPCADDCDCSCNYATGQCTACPCTCTCGCIGTRADGSRICGSPSHPASCACGEVHVSTCVYACATVYSYPRTGCVRDANTCTSACDCDTSYCVTPYVTPKCNSDASCRCSSTCDYGCYSNGQCKPTPTCSVYDSYCVEEHGAGSYSIWSEISQSCVCVEPPTTPKDGCPTEYDQCGDGSCCAPGTICQQFSGAWRCTLGESDPEPEPDPNTTPTAPTSLQTEGLTNPTTVSDLTPEFSAIFNDPDTSDSSNYYQIQVNTNSSFTGTGM